MTASPIEGGLDEHVHAANQALEAVGVPAPDVLLFPATGMGPLVHAMDGGVSIELGAVDGVPATFAGATLVAGQLGGTSTWVIEDAPESHVHASGRGRTPFSPWAAAFPVWLAAAADAKVLVHLSAGTALAGPQGPGDDDLEPGSIARVTDHINLSGTSPLLGLGESRLGPLFPDQTRVHDTELGALVERVAGELGDRLHRAVAACTLGPALFDAGRAGLLPGGRRGRRRAAPRRSPGRRRPRGPRRHGARCGHRSIG